MYKYLKYEIKDEYNIQDVYHLSDEELFAYLDAKAEKMKKFSQPLDEKAIKYYSELAEEDSKPIYTKDNCFKKS